MSVQSLRAKLECFSSADRSSLSLCWAGCVMLDTKTVRAALSLSGVQSVSGYRFGLRQPFLLARVDVASHLNVSEALAQQVWEQVSASLPERYRLAGPAHSDAPVQRLMHTLVPLVGAMQNSVGLPVIDVGQAVRQRPAEQPEDSRDSLSWVLALPCFTPRAAELALRELGIPTPPFRLVKSEGELAGATQAMGFPCVTKPIDRGSGKGVSAGLRSIEAKAGFGRHGK